jgi:CHAT domain-containing protein
MLRDRMAIFYVTAGGKTTGVETVNLTGETLRRMVNHFDDLLQRRADVALLQNDAKLLYQSLISPVAPHIAGATEVVIVADRELQALPFAALVNPATRRYLIEEIGVDVAPSATFIERAFGPRQLSPALIVGDPKSDGTPALPDAVREAEAIAGMYSAATLLTGDRATPAHFVDAAQRSGIIHYSGHAQSDTTSADGTLRLAGTERENGVLDASDIARLKLRAAPMVVLAACGTMRGDVDHVEGMPSLARAFLAAGARSVVGTLWEIDDETAAHLFRRFHQQLRAGDSPSAALRQTQLTALNDPDPRLRHPSTWAPLEVLGTVN